MTPELVPFVWLVTCLNDGAVFSYRAAGIENLDSVQLSLLGYSVGLGADGTSAVSAVT